MDVPSDKDQTQLGYAVINTICEGNLKTVF